MEGLLLASGAQSIKYVDSQGIEHSFEAEGGELLERFPKLLSRIVSFLEEGSQLVLEDGSSSVRLIHKGIHVEVVSSWNGEKQKALISISKSSSTEEQDYLKENKGTERSDEHLSSDAPVAEKTVTFIPPESQSRPEENKDISSSYSWMSPSICRRYQLKAPYVAGAMAGGIASVSLVRAMSEAQMLAFFGAGGLSLEEIEKAVSQLSSLSGPWGSNLLHAPHDIELEEQTVDLYLKYGVRIVSASAYMRLTPAVVRYRVSGICVDGEGNIHTPNQIFAKVSHPSVAEQFLSPPPTSIVQRLVQKGVLTEEQAVLAQKIPMAEQITVEGDSGGHTDRRPLLALFPVIDALREEQILKYGFSQKIFLGAAGGLGTPEGLACALMLGADYLLVGSVHQSTVEAGTSDLVKTMLAQSSVHDFSMGVSPDMFEQGAMVQVLSRGSMYAQRANRLRELYLRYRDLNELPQKDLSRLEKSIFAASIGDVWNETQDYWKQRNPKILLRAERDPHFKMSLIFRWYLGRSSRWARMGTEDRKRDFQIWSGPAMGAFNNWVQGTSLEPLDMRNIVDVAEALLEATALIFQNWKHRMDVI
ncbi:MAG: 2-nitropropane dioxygenase [Proteobacteria bacterium]|nr:2-nitropropane dioxygenase [Pseudomonadota bacterium]